MTRVLQVVALLLTGCGLFVYAQRQVGSDSTHSWTLVNNSDPAPTITGQIDSFRYNSSNPWDDHDINLMLIPDGPSRRLLTNRAGNPNGTCPDGTGTPGKIELEIVTFEDTAMSSRFRAGRYLRAKGLWTQDTGHCFNTTDTDDKTEIHPIQYMMASDTPDPLTAANFTIFAGKDFSGRFSQPNVDVYNFYIAFPRGEATIRPDLGQTGGQSNVGVLSENSMLDLFESAPEARSEIRVPQGVVMSGADAHYIVSLPPIPGSHGPLYLADFSRGSQQLFTDSVTYKLVPIRAGGKELHIDVKATLQQPSSVPQLSTTWFMSANIPAGRMSGANTTAAPHTFSFTGRYSPSVGINDSKWELTLLATNRAENWLPPTAEAGFANRTFVRKIQTYEIEPSSVTIQTPRSAPPSVQTGQAGSAVPQKLYPCQSAAVYTAVEKLLPQVQVVPGSLEWRIQELRDGGVTFDFVNVGRNRPAILSSVPSNKVVAGTPLVRADYKAELDPSNDHKLNVTFTNQYADNNTELRITFSERTDLGEVLTDKVTVNGRCIPPTYDFDLWFESLLKASIAMRRILEPPTLLGRLMGTTPTLVLADFVEPEILISRLSGQDRTKAEVLGKYFADGALTRKEGTILEGIAADGRKLTWSTPPSKDLLQRAIGELGVRAFGRDLEHGRLMQKTVASREVIVWK